ncbi:SprT-like family-domain-containing protein, partial [Neohortaea acidophila]
PPQSPSKSRLQSPSKSKPRVPSQQIRQSLDAFWDADRVNDWNDQYSPHKVLKSPRKLKFTVDERSVSPFGSPRKLQSPAKDAVRAEREAKKAFEARKHRLAEDFLAELDRVVADGEIQRLASTTGGVKFIWSKTLNTTAGRANWRKETTKTTSPDGSIHATYKHFASIELAEKVINDAHRLLNVIAHEFCHLCNFMLSGIKDQPHGRQFQLWGAKCTRAFAERGVRVTTKHSYQIDYRYVWQCSNEECGAEFKRHSKSIDPARQSCG